ncbi:MAG: S1 RNA-binding domain-containing protein [Planctomycetaceae bacterium]
MSSEHPMSENVPGVSSSGTDDSPSRDDAPAASPANSSSEAAENSSSANDATASAHDAAADAGATEAERPKRRVMLNPTVSPEQVKAIPSYPSSPKPRHENEENAPAPSGEVSAGAQLAANEHEQPADQTATNAESAERLPSDADAPSYDEMANAQPFERVEIPSADIDLDPEMEAQIEAAMAGGISTPEAALPDASTGEAAPAVMSEDALQPGTRLKGTIQSTHGDAIFVDLGVRSPGILPSRQFEGKALPEVGSKLDVIVDKVDAAEGLIHVSIPRAKRRPGGQWDSLQKGNIVECLVAKTNKGGLEVTIGSLRGFLPASQVDLGFVSDMESFIGQKLTVQITDLNPQKRNLVVSRRAILIQERQEAGEKLWQEVEVSQQRTGRVKTLKDYGAFIDLGGIDGFLHIGEISWSRIKHPSEMLTEGQEVDVQILAVDREHNKISLGMRQLVQDPWADVETRFPVGSTQTGTVTRATDFGAFVELTHGVEGLVHISELDHRRVRRVTEVVKVGQQIDVKVLEVDPERKRISLSLKALIAQPQAEPGVEEPAPVEPPRKRKGPLKGGNSGTVSRSSSAGGLFGNPSDFQKP